MPFRTRTIKPTSTIRYPIVFRTYYSVLQWTNPRKIPPESAGKASAGGIRLRASVGHKALRKARLLPLRFTGSISGFRNTIGRGSRHDATSRCRIVPLVGTPECPEGEAPLPHNFVRGWCKRWLLPSHLNVGVVLLDPVGHPVAPQRYELQRGFPNPDVLVLRGRDAGALEVLVLL